MTEMCYENVLNYLQTQYGVSGNPFHQDITTDADFKKPEWVKIPLKLNKYKKELLPLIIAINEILRFENGPTQPEVYVTSKYILSKKVPQGPEVDMYSIRKFLSYWHELTGPNKTFWQGMGRVIGTKYLYQDNDFSVHNVLVDKDSYFVGIDVDKCFWTVTAKYHYHKNIKVLANNNSNLPVRRAYSITNHPIFVLEDKSPEFIGELHKDDYETLPLLKHQYPTDWIFHYPELTPFAQELRNQELFQNEKHFAAAKAVVTKDIKKLLLDLHLENNEDKAAAINFVETQLEKLRQICVESAAFKKYITQNRNPVLSIILYEMNVFFRSNPQYDLGEITSDAMHCFTQSIIEKYTALLSDLGLPVSKHEEHRTARDFINQLCVAGKETYARVRESYLGQKMTLMAARVV